jgi:hypothetical protein
MATDHPIPPFPTDIDREAFGHWLSGFVDGEGCFLLAMYARRANPLRKTPMASLRILLRADDLPILQEIQSFFGCGHINTDRRLTCFATMKAPHEGRSLTIGRAADLATRVVPHFERFTLRAKKARDFEVWKQGVLLVHRVVGNSRGSGVPWTDPLLEQFQSLCQRLKDGRRYESPTTAR